jgi:ubiquitin-like protein Pup
MEQKTKESAKVLEDEEIVEPKKLESDIDVSAILDEIDNVLEKNAEEFVQGYVQKGGE